MQRFGRGLSLHSGELVGQAYRPRLKPDSYPWSPVRISDPVRSKIEAR